MGKAWKIPGLRGGVILLLVALIAAVGVGTALSRRHGGASATAALPSVAVSSTIPYRPRPGVNGTKVLTEAIDPLSVSVPNDWKAPSADHLTLPAELDAFSQQAPSLVGLVQVLRQAAGKSAVRLFAYRATAPFAFISVISYASPGAIPLTPDIVAAVEAEGKKVPNVAVSGARLPVGEVMKIDTSPVRGTIHLVVEVLIFVSGGRTLLVEMASEVSEAGIPPLFEQMAQSLSQR